AGIDTVLENAGLPKPVLDGFGDYWSPGSDVTLPFTPAPLPSIPPIRVQSAVLAGGALGVVSAEAKASPLILDIDQSGTIDLISLNDTRTYWDIDEDGFAELS